MTHPSTPTQYYVYKLISSLDRKPFYVGKGHGSRMFHHVAEKDRTNHNHNNRLLKNKINKILSQGGAIIYNRRFTKTEQQAFMLECALIAKYGRRDNGTGILCNMTNGGDGVAGHIRSDAWRLSSSERARARAKPVVQFTKDGVEVQTWDTVRAASVALGIDNTSISQCCNGRLKSAGGFRWTWVGKVLAEWKHIRKQHKQHKQHKQQRTLHQFDMIGNHLASFESQIEAGKKIDKHANTILECIKGRSSHAGWYRWSYQSCIARIEPTVFQYDNGGHCIAEYVSVSHACHTTKLAQSNLLVAINNPGRRKCGGFYWSKTKVAQLHIVDRVTTGKPVRQLTSDGSIIGVFESAKQAQQHTGINGIANCVAGRVKTAGGYVWQYNSLAIE